MSEANDAVLRFSQSDAGWGIIARKRVRAITGGRLPTVEDYHAALVQCLRDKAAEIARLRLTDAEREAVEAVLDDPDLVLGDAREPLRGLLERTRDPGSK